MWEISSSLSFHTICTVNMGHCIDICFLVPIILPFRGININLDPKHCLLEALPDVNMARHGKRQNIPACSNFNTFLAKIPHPVISVCQFFVTFIFLDFQNFTVFIKFGSKLSQSNSISTQPNTSNLNMNETPRYRKVFRENKVKQVKQS